MTAPPPSKQMRGAPMVAKVLDTALAEIARVGLEHLSIEEVAARARVNKTTIYRRWPSPRALAMSVFERGADTFDLPNTGSLRTDLLAYLQRFRTVCRSPAMLSLARMRIGPDEADDELGRLVRQRVAQGERKALAMFERAVGRGELPPDADVALLRDLVIASAHHFMMFRDEDCADATIERIVDTILLGALRAGSDPDRPGTSGGR